jgi:ankyrin repeat protein
LVDFINHCYQVETGSLDSRSIHEMGIQRITAFGDIQQISYLHSKFPEFIHMKDDNAWEPIHEAARSNSLEAVKFLVEHGADVNAVTNTGTTALWLARHSRDGSDEVVAYLEDIGAREEGGSLNVSEL